MTVQEQMEFLVNHPEELIKKKPFTRGSETHERKATINSEVLIGEKLQAELPTYERKVISQSRYAAELDPDCHDVLFDENIPSITAKTADGNYATIEFKKMAVPFQKMIRNKHVLHLCGYGIQFTLSNEEPSEEQKKDFATFKQYWKDRNQDGMRTKMVSTQKSYGDAGLLYYFDRHGKIKSRVLSYEDGYVLCPHNDMNGDRLAESVYYKVDNVEYIDTYFDEVQYRHIKDNNLDHENNGWRIDPNINGVPHGFKEIPLVTKRGPVAWDAVQTIIEVYEIIYNIFLVIQKRHGWGILYIKGNFSDTAKKIAGAVVLNDNSLNKDGSAQYLTPPTPQGMLDTLKLMEETIQKGSGTTFLLPKDISQSGDISGVAIQITQSLDNEEALGGVIEWQNVASKMCRLFLYGLAKELAREGDSTAITRFSSLNISAAFKQWRPRNDTEYNQMLVTLKSNGLISQKTGIERNTESTPDEEIRVAAEAAEAEMKALEEAAAAAETEEVEVIEEK